MVDPLPAAGSAATLPLWQNAGWRPSHHALLTADGAWTYREMADAADRWAAALAAAGLRRGDVLGSLFENGSEAVLALQSAWRLGAVICPFNTRLSPVELRQQCRLVNPRMLLTQSQRTADLDPLSAPVSGLTARPLTVMAGDRPAADTIAMCWAPLAPATTAPLRAEPAGVTADDRAALLFTSGTSGRLKAAILTHGGLQSHAAASALRLGCLPDDIWLAPLPLFHVGGLAIIVRSTLAGTTMALSRSGRAPDIAEALEQWPVTLVSLVPTQLRMLLEIWPGPPPRRLRTVLLGGAAADDDLLRAARQRGWPVAVTYGLTEAGSQVATTWPDADPDLSEGVGVAAPPLPLTQIEIRDGQGQCLPAGQIGDIWVRGPGLMVGYLNDPAASAEALVAGWLRTGDLGRLDLDGRLRVAARRDDLIVSGGENIYPAEVEAVLASHPDIQEACVVAAPDPVWGHMVWAAIVPTLIHSDAVTVELPQTLPSGLDAWVAERLAAYKRPRRYLVLASLPRTASGKVSRTGVRQALGLDAGDG